MKKHILCIILIFIPFIAFCEGKISTERIYCNRIISFNRIYDIYYTNQPCGYYRFEKEIDGKKCFLTYESANFYEQCKFDQNLYVITKNVPMNMYTNSRGEVMRFRPKFGPVIEKDRKAKNYPYGYGQNYGGHFIQK